ncbi:MAG: hypothetical protein E7774_12700 [Bradyrhizobium sp.]|nr:MAG: hypothetical protein E7774_12700 [Bradyrhizobium sp.]
MPLRRCLTRAVLACAGAAAGLVGLGFATAAVLESLRVKYDAIDAAAAVAGFYLLLAVILFVWRSAVGARRGVAPRGQARSQASAAQATSAALGLELAQQMTPFQLVLAAALAGFVAGRKT